MTKRTVQIHGKEYELVASRVERFRKEHQELSIVTKIIERTEDTVVMWAGIMTIDGTKLATGHAEERRTASPINKTSALENAETSAIGRALACFGYIGGEFASADEVANAISQQKKKEFKVKATPKQLQYLYNLCKQDGITDKEAATEKIKLEAAIENINDLTSDEASEIIADWQERLRDERPSNATSE